MTHVNPTVLKVFDASQSQTLSEATISEDVYSFFISEELVPHQEEVARLLILTAKAFSDKAIKVYVSKELGVK
jgi:hypothetical protein